MRNIRKLKRANLKAIPCYHFGGKHLLKLNIYTYKVKSKKQCTNKYY